MLRLNEIKLSLSDHPQYVQNGFNKHILFATMIVLCTLAAAISLRSGFVLLYGGLVSLIYFCIIFHLYYMLTRDKVLVFEGKCIDIISIGPGTKKIGATKLVLKSVDQNNDRTYSIVNKSSYHCNIGDGVSLYTTENAMYVDSNDYVVINRPLFIKITKNR